MRPEQKMEVIQRKLPDNIPAFLYNVRLDDTPETAVEVRFDSFIVGWRTEVPFRSFFPHASFFLGGLKKRHLPSNGSFSVNPLKIVRVEFDEEGHAEGSTLHPPSYSGFGINNVIAGGCPEISFDELTWPLDFENIHQTALRKGYDYFIEPTTSETEMARINGEHCTLIYDGEEQSIHYWSHTLPLANVWDLYRKTARRQLPKDDFWNITTTLIEKHNNPNLSVL